MQPQTQIIDTVNEDGSVTRVFTSTTTFTAEQYQRIVDQKLAQITKLTEEVAPLQTVMKASLAKTQLQ